MKDIITTIVEPHDVSFTYTVQSNSEVLNASKNDVIVDIRKPNVMDCYHWHSHVEVNIPFDGDVEYTINDRIVTVKANQIGVFLASIPHRVSANHGCTKFGIIYISLKKFIEWTLDSISELILSGEFVVAKMSSVLSLDTISQWQHEINNGLPALSNISKEEIRLFLMRIAVKELNDKVRIKNVDHSANNIMSEILLYISRNFRSNIKTRDIAEHLGLSPNYVTNIFTKNLGITIRQYILNLRVSYAKALLIDTNLSITEIIYLSGFFSKNSFYLAFNHIAGCSPKDYRKSGFVVRLY
ncbi:helix-turn-helix domain-containing protein [Photobacterium indicum]|uniref:helix-turn-helix domain-containing protein n=1 Tax=Photobacterium indicum TaxID=81447 RepID=UPI003D0EB40B